MIGRLLPFVTILIAVGLFFGYINPTYTGSVAAERAEIASYDNALAAAEAFAKKENDLLAERNSVPAEGIKRLEVFLPDGVDNVQLILDLDALANRSGIKLSDFEMDVAKATSGAGQSAGTLPLDPQTPIESLSLEVSATGTYEAFRTFLTGVETSLRPLDLVSMEVQDSDTGVYSYDMVFAIYWLR